MQISPHRSVWPAENFVSSMVSSNEFASDRTMEDEFERLFIFFASFTIVSFAVYMVFKLVSGYVYNQKKQCCRKSRRRINGGANISLIQERRDMGDHESYVADSRFYPKVYAAVFLKSAVTLRRDAVYNALVLLSRKHPLLRANVDIRMKGYSFYENLHECDMQRKQFVIRGAREFRPELRFVNTSHWKIVLEEELLVNKKNKCSIWEPLWRTILLREQYHSKDRLFINSLLFFFDQVIMDRRSIVPFIEDFTKFLCQLVNCDIHVDDTRALKLQGPPELLLKDPPFWKSLKFMVHNKLNKLFSFGASLEIFHRSKRQKMKSLFLTQSLSIGETSRLLHCCRRMKCSLTSVFVASWLQMHAGHSANGNVPQAVFKKPVSVVMDYRNSLTTPFPSSYLGNSSSNIVLHLSVEQQEANFWSSVEHCESLLNSAMKNEEHLDFIWKLKQGMLGRLTSRSDFEIADVGQFNLIKTHPFSLEDIYIGASGVSEAILTLVVINKKLYCGIQLSSHLDNSECSGFLKALITMIEHHVCSLPP